MNLRKIITNLFSDFTPKMIPKYLLLFVAIIGICVGFNVLSYSANLTLPDKYVYVSSSSSAYHYPWSSNTGAEYLGGDAYNYMIEASLKAGYYSAVRQEKAVTWIGGILLIFASLFTGIASVISLLKGKDADQLAASVQTIASSLTHEPEPTQTPEQSTVRQDADPADHAPAARNPVPDDGAVDAIEQGITPVVYDPEISEESSASEDEAPAVYDPGIGDKETGDPQNDAPKYYDSRFAEPSDRDPDSYSDCVDWNYGDEASVNPSPVGKKTVFPIKHDAKFEDDFYEEIGRTIREKKELSSEAPATDAAGEQID